MNSHITLQKNNHIRGRVVNLPSSKSISNRAIIINALAGNSAKLINLSDANDTQLMLRLITSTDEVLDVEDAGTTMRFLTAFHAVSRKSRTITGTERMQHRPIKLLVDTLRTIGAEIDYAGQDGYPPVNIRSFKAQQNHQVTIKGDVSSQYISALMMIAPTLPKGLRILFEGKVTSRPYIEMTASLMRQFGAHVDFTDVGINIPHQKYRSTDITVESDWSAASYWFAFTALAGQAEITLPNITLESLQGDHVIVDIMDRLGVQATLTGSNDLILTKKGHVSTLEWNFVDCPDLAQTVAVVCAAKGVTGKFTGLESLRIKETDRIKALQTELAKIGASLTEEKDAWVLTPSQSLGSSVFINTYLDHRMAMAFAPLATLMEVTLEDPAVTRKSYPEFWKDVELVGIKATVA